MTTNLPYSCLDNPHGQRSLVGYSPRGHKALDTTERLSTKVIVQALLVCENCKAAEVGVLG